MLTIVLMASMTACGEHHVSHFTIERDGPIQALSLAEFSSVGISPFFIKYSSKEEAQYIQIDPYVLENPGITSPDLLLSMQQLAAQNNGVVDNNIYNFAVMIPVKTRQRLFALPSIFDLRTLDLRRCKPLPLYKGDNKAVIRMISPNPDSKGELQDEQGFYHYRIYRESNMLAQIFFFNPVRDWCVQYRYFYSVAYGDSWDITSNTITVPAQEVRAMLDGMGIAHELDMLDF